jgi:hypothetical protein
VLAFAGKTARLQRAVQGAVEAVRESLDRIRHIKTALNDTPGADPLLREEAARIEARLKDMSAALTGEETLRSRNEPTIPAIAERVREIVYGQWSTTSAPTQTQRHDYDIAASEFAPLLADLRTLVLEELRPLEEKAEASGAPWTPGRLPAWRPE